MDRTAATNGRRSGRAVPTRRSARGRVTTRVDTTPIEDVDSDSSDESTTASSDDETIGEGKKGGKQWTELEKAFVVWCRHKDNPMQNKIIGHILRRSDQAIRLRSFHCKKTGKTLATLGLTPKMSWPACEKKLGLDPATLANGRRYRDGRPRRPRRSERRSERTIENMNPLRPRTAGNRVSRPAPRRVSGTASRQESRVIAGPSAARPTAAAANANMQRGDSDSSGSSGMDALLQAAAMHTSSQEEQSGSSTPARARQPLPTSTAMATPFLAAAGSQDVSVTRPIASGPSTLRRLTTPADTERGLPVREVRREGGLAWYGARTEGRTPLAESTPSAAGTPPVEHTLPALRTALPALNAPFTPQQEAGALRSYGWRELPRPKLDAPWYAQAPLDSEDDGRGAERRDTVFDEINDPARGSEMSEHINMVGRNSRDEIEEYLRRHSQGNGMATE